MASSQAKFGWKRPKNRENTNYRFVSFLPNGQQKIPQKQPKNSENLNNTILPSFEAKIV